MGFLVSQVMIRLDFMGRASPVENKVYVVSRWEMKGQVATTDRKNQKEVEDRQN